jgi:nucleotide-binding universal stress UspA family protein
MILCGTDLSAASQPTTRAAAAIARKRGLALLLVHVADKSEPYRDAAVEAQLAREASALRHDFEIPVDVQLAEGSVGQVLLGSAAARGVSLIVVGARGSGRHGHRLGSVPELLCQRAEVPVLVVKSPEPLLAWDAGRGPLRVVVGSGLGDASLCALECAASWPERTLTVVHVAWAFGEHYRLGIGGPMPLDHLRPEVQEQLLGELGRWAADSRAGGPMKLDVVAGFGRIDCHLAQAVEERGADLLVIGTHQRNLADRLWQGSVSRSAIHEASCNVLCVPQRSSRPRVASAPQTVVIPTDLSPLGDRAIPRGYSVVDRDGTVHLVHVVSSLADVNETELRARLAARIPEADCSRRVRTELRIVEGGSPWLAIWQYASRANADLICMATHSRDAVKSLVIGSEARDLLAHARVPVLLVPPDRES